MERIRVEREFDYVKLEMEAVRIGKDVAVALSGGEAHIGSSVVASSKIKEGENVILLPGHRDDVVCKIVAEAIMQTLDTTVVCTGGIHVDDISKEQIVQIVDVVGKMAKELAAALLKN